MFVTVPICSGSRHPVSSRAQRGYTVPDRDHTATCYSRATPPPPSPSPSPGDCGGTPSSPSSGRAAPSRATPGKGHFNKAVQSYRNTCFLLSLGNVHGSHLICCPSKRPQQKSCEGRPSPCQ